MASNSLVDEGWIRKLQQTSIPSFSYLASCLRGKQSVDRNTVRQRGFTLIELMIVVAVLGILAAIAYPSFLDQIRKTRRSDGKAALLETAQVLERCFTEFNRYNSASCPAVNNGDVTQLSASYTTTEENYYAISSAGSLTTTAFTLRATPTGAHADDNDNTEPNRCGVLTYNQQGAKGVVAGTGTLSTNSCW